MKILRVADVADNRTGGMSRVMYGSGEAMTRMGHQVDYVFSNHLGCVSTSRFRRFVIPIRAAKVIAQRHREQGPYDIVEIHEPSAAFYLWRRFRSAEMPPCVVLSYGIEARGQAAKLTYRQRHRLPVSIKQRISPWTVILQAQYALRRADHVICFNSEDFDFLTRMGRQAGEVTCTHSGIDPAFLEAGQQRKPDPEAALALLFLGSWIERKGIRDLVTAATQVFAQHPDARLTVAGCGCDEQRVLADFDECDRGHVSVIRHVRSNAELIDIYARHGVFVLPSYFEGQPLSMLEAAAMGLAIVTTEVCGMRDFVASGENGLLIPAGDSAALGDALLHVTGRPAETCRLGSAARDTVQAFTWDSVATDMLDAYESALSRCSMRLQEH